MDPQDTSAQDAYLQSVLQGAPAPSDAAPPPMAAPTPAADPAQADPTQVAGVSVTAPPAQGMNYSSPDSTQAAQSAQQALTNPAYQPSGGTANPGIFGLLPQSMQHGTLRNVLGALGDAFLVGSGHNAEYAPRMERQQEGLALSNYANKPEQALGLLGATGAPDAIKDVIGLQENQNNVQMHKDQLTQQTQYRNDNLQLRTDENARQTQAAQANQAKGLIPQWGAIANRAQTPEQYQKVITQADAKAKAINPAFTHTDLGLADPEDWKVGMNQGATTGQVMGNDAKTAARAQAGRDTDVQAQSKIQAAYINARKNTNGMGALQAEIVNEADVNGIESLTPAKRAVFDKLTNIPKKSQITLAPSAGAAAGPAGGGATPPGGKQQSPLIHTYPSGRQAVWNGKAWVPK